MIVVAAVVVLLVTGVAVRRGDGNRLTACALALVPYAVVAGLLASAGTLALGLWWTGGTVLAATAVLGADLLPRMLPRPKAAGRRVRVLAANLYFGKGDIKTVIELVRTHQVDVLNLLELTPESADEFARAGLLDLLPHRILRPAHGGGGSALLSRHPVTELTLAGPSRLAQPSARIHVDGTPLEVVAVHPVPPIQSAVAWKAELAGLPKPDSNIRILAGDFNATLDHAVFRRLLRTGYRDAARQRGRALAPTWRLGSVPVASLDHVLVDQRAGVTAFRVFDVPGSDHKAVYAELTLPDVTPR